MDITAYQQMNIRMSTRGKRPLRNLTPNDKVRAIQRIHNGETKASVSRDIGVPESTLRGWCKNEQKLRFMCRQLGTDQLPLVALENPPEKRSKFDPIITTPKISNLAGFEDFAYNRLPLNAMDLTASGNGSANALIEKYALSEFLNKHGSFSNETNKQFGGNFNGQLPTFTNALPISTDYNMMQNLNLLSLINPSLASLSSPSSLSAGSVSSVDGGSKLKVPLRNANIVDDAKNTASTLSVKNWAKEPLEQLTLLNNNNNNSKNISNSNKRNTNDTNNNDLKAKNNALAPMVFPEMLGNFPAFFPANLLQMSNALNAADAEGSSSNTATPALVEWYKFINASVNFIALASAAAALQTPAMSTANANGNDENTVKTAEMGNTPIENILYKQLTKTTQSSLNALTNGSYINSDLSNDSYFDSEPEDLSVRSTTSKISSPANSRSQSPTKSTASISSSIHSDDIEQ